MSDSLTTRFSIRSGDDGVPENIVVRYATHGHAPCLEVVFPDGRFLLVGHGCGSDGYEIGLYDSESDFYDDEGDALIVLVDGDNEIVGSGMSPLRTRRETLAAEKKKTPPRIVGDVTGDALVGDRVRWGDVEWTVDSFDEAGDLLLRSDDSSLPLGPRLSNGTGIEILSRPTLRKLDDDDPIVEKIRKLEAAETVAEKNAARDEALGVGTDPEAGLDPACGTCGSRPGDHDGNVACPECGDPEIIAALELEEPDEPTDPNLDAEISRVAGAVRRDLEDASSEELEAAGSLYDRIAREHPGFFGPEKRDYPRGSLAARTLGRTEATDPAPIGSERAALDSREYPELDEPDDDEKPFLSMGPGYCEFEKE